MFVDSHSTYILSQAGIGNQCRCEIFTSFLGDVKRMLGMNDAKNDN